MRLDLDLQFLDSYVSIAKDLALIIFAILGFPLLRKRTHSANLTARAAMEKSISERYLNALKMIESGNSSSRMSGFVELLDIAEKRPEYQETVALAAKNYIAEKLHYVRKFVGTADACVITEENRRKLVALVREKK